MEIAERTIGDITILDLKGRLVAGEGDDALRVAVDGLVQRGRIKVLLNMDEVPYVDSGGLGVLASKYVTLRKRGGDLKMYSVGPRCSRVLTITRLLTVFESYASEADGVSSFAGRS